MEAIKEEQKIIEEMKKELESQQNNNRIQKLRMEEMKAENKILKTNEFDLESRTKNTELKIAKLETAIEHILQSTLPVGEKPKKIK